MADEDYNADNDSYAILGVKSDCDEALGSTAPS